MRLLLVEDDALIGEGVRAGLKLAGYTVDWVKDGQAAALAIGNGVYDARRPRPRVAAQGRAVAAARVAREG